MRIKTFTAAMLLGLAISSAPAAGTFYTTESSFVSAIDPVFYLEDFNSFTNGSPLDGTQLAYNAPGANGYGWTAACPGGCFSNPGALSVSLSETPITITFTGAPVTAFGGLFADTDVNFNFISGMVTIVTSDGGMITVPTTTEAFVGYTTTSPIVSVTFSAASGASDFIQIDHFYTGAALIPEPETMALLVLGFATTASLSWFRNIRARSRY